MSSPTTTQIPFESRYPELALPPGGFQSKIPPHLLNGQDEQFEWLMHEVSKNTAATEFACRGAVDLSQHLRTLNGRVYRNEKATAEAEAGVAALNEQAQVVTPFLKPISMFASLWGYTTFRWFFTGGIVFFMLVLYPWLLKIGLLDLLDSYFRGH